MLETSSDKISNVSKLKTVFEEIKSGKHRVFLSVTLIIIIISIISLIFVSSNQSFYKKTIAKITIVSNTKSDMPTTNGKNEEMTKQEITAKILNGKYKDKNIKLENTSSFSQVNDYNFKVNDEVFVSVQGSVDKQTVSGKILDFKRDNYLVYITMIFVVLILLIGGVKGFRSLTSVIINIVIFSVVIQLFLNNWNLTLVCIIASILFIILSISIVCGINKKALSAVVGTMAGTLISMIIAIVVIQSCHWSGVHFEEMEFLTHPPEQIFYMEILIGTLGAIMDIAISISSAISEIYEKNPNIENKVLIRSAMEIGKDIMGTMANTLVFAYLSGSIPIILLVLRNSFPISYIVSINLSLEIIRALTGSIGIVLSIPITILTSVLLIKNKRIGEIIKS